MKKNSTLFLLLLCVNIAFAQKPDFSKPDSIAMQCPVIKDPEVLARQLTKDLDSDLMKARALFRWITLHVKYDTRKYQSGTKEVSFSYTDDDDLEALIKKQEIEEAENVLKKLKGVCHDYSILYKILCEYAGIRCELIEGYSRRMNVEIKKNSAPDHAWNAILIDGKWYLCDVTWASGYTDYAVTKYIQEFNEYCFMTSPELFVLNHYPSDTKWLLTEKEITFEEFTSSVFLFSHDILPHLRSIAPLDGILPRNEDARIHIELDTTVSEIGVQNSTMKYYDRLTVADAGNFVIPAKYIKGKSIYIIIGGKFLLQYQLK